MPAPAECPNRVRSNLLLGGALLVMQTGGLVSEPDHQIFRDARSNSTPTLNCCREFSLIIAQRSNHCWRGSRRVRRWTIEFAENSSNDFEGDLDQSRIDHSGPLPRYETSVSIERREF